MIYAAKMQTSALKTIRDIIVMLTEVGPHTAAPLRYVCRVGYSVSWSEARSEQSRAESDSDALGLETRRV